MRFVPRRSGQSVGLLRERRSRLLGIYVAGLVVRRAQEQILELPCRHDRSRPAGVCRGRHRDARWRGTAGRRQSSDKGGRHSSPDPVRDRFEGGRSIPGPTRISTKLKGSRRGQPTKSIVNRADGAFSGLKWTSWLLNRMLNRTGLRFFQQHSLTQVDGTAFKKARRSPRQHGATDALRTKNLGRCGIILHRLLLMPPQSIGTAELGYFSNCRIMVKAVHPTVITRSPRLLELEMGRHPQAVSKT